MRFPWGSCGGEFFTLCVIHACLLALVTDLDAFLEQFGGKSRKGV